MSRCSRVGCPSKLVSIRNNRNWNLVSALSAKCLLRLFRFYTKTEIFDVSIEPKQTEDQPKQFDREHILVFLWKFRVVSVCFGLFRNSSVCFNCFDIGLKHRNKPKQTKTFSFWFNKTNRNKPETDLVSVCFGSNRNFFCLFLGHPTLERRCLCVHKRGN
jgi:hypothetical protein